MTVVRSFCRICIANCGILAEVEHGPDGDRVVKISGDPDHPISQGYVCPKGRALADAHHSPHRLTSSLVRREGTLMTTPAHDAISAAAEALAATAAQHGVQSVGFFMGSGAFIDPAGVYAFARLKAGLGTPQIYSTASVDSVAKTYVSAVMAGSTALVPHPDELGTLMLLVGSNPLVSHGQSTGFANPVQRIRDAVARGEVYVIDPRFTETARLAGNHVPARPGTDHAVLGFLVHDVLKGGYGLDAATLAATTVNLTALRAAVAPFDLHTTSELTGVAHEQLTALAASVRRAGRLAVITGTGASMSPAGNFLEWFAWALMIVTGSFDKPGGMWFNPGYRTRIDRRERLPRVRLDQPGPTAHPDILRLNGEWPASVIPEEIESGRLQALVIFGANAVTCLPDTPRVTAALQALPTLVVLEVDRTETAELATHVIACHDQLERPDVLPLDMFANRVYDQYTPAVVHAHPGRVASWMALEQMGAALGLHVFGTGIDPATMDADAVLDLTTRDPEALRALRAADGPVLTDDAHYDWVQSRLPDGVWDLAPAALVEQLRTYQPCTSMLLTPRRQLRHQNSQRYRDGDDSTAWLHPTDAAALSIHDGQLVELSSAVGTLSARVRVTDANMVGTVSVPHGWAHTNVNQLISATDLDQFTGMPQMSGTPVTLKVLEPS